MYTGSKIVEDERSQLISQKTQHKHVSGYTCCAAKVCCTDHRFAFRCLMPCLATAARATCVDMCDCAIAVAPTATVQHRGPCSTGHPQAGPWPQQGAPVQCPPVQTGVLVPSQAHLAPHHKGDPWAARGWLCRQEEDHRRHPLRSD